MSAFNRNIITNGDITNLLTPGTRTPKTLDSAPPAGHIPAEVLAPAPPGGTPSPAAPPAAPGGVTVPTSDDYLTKLVKYVPLEVLGAYLFAEDLITTNVEEPDKLQSWLFWTLVVALGVAALYSKSVLGVVRATQLAMGALGLAVYVFATGGWFATTDWYEDWFSGLALMGFAILVAMIKLPALPQES